MKLLSFLQIGDVHFPEAKNDLFIDAKDDAVLSALSGRLVPNKLQNTVREARRIVDKGLGKDGILLCGDLTTRGDKAGYRECLTYLAKALQIGDPNRWPNDHLHAVLGNHDVDRATTPVDGLFAKFDAFRSAWEALRPSILAVDAVRDIAIDVDGCHAKVFSLNSCIGCGERRYLPQPVKDQLYNLLAPFFSSAALNADDFELIGEQLDTPAFIEDHVTTVVEGIQTADVNTAVLVLAHHGLLSQAVLRLAVYTELINGGLARFRLSGCKRPVVFCHGHVHDDPIEVVRQARLSDGELILISAPELRSGFNVINICFSHCGVPIGCEVLPYRLARHGGISSEPSVRVRMTSEKFRLQDTHPLVPRVLGALGRDFKRFRDVVNDTRSITGTHHQERSIEACLQEADWLGLVEVLNRTETPKHWEVRRVEP